MVTGLDNLKIYKLSEELELLVFEATKKFPADEKFRSVDQLRRSSSAATNNIVEGYSRYTYKEKIRFFIIARAEAEETKRGFLRSAKKDFIFKEMSSKISNDYTVLIKGINGYIRFLRKKMEKSQSPNHLIT